MILMLILRKVSNDPRMYTDKHAIDNFNHIYKHLNKSILIIMVLWPFILVECVWCKMARK